MYSLDQLLQGSVYPIETSAPLHRGLSGLFSYATSLKQQTRTALRQLIRQSLLNSRCKSIVFIASSTVPSDWFTPLFWSVFPKHTETDVALWMKKIHWVDLFTLDGAQRVDMKLFSSYTQFSIDQPLTAVVEKVVSLSNDDPEVLVVLDSTSEIILTHGIREFLRFSSGICNRSKQPPAANINHHMERFFNYFINVQPSEGGPSNPNFSCECLVLKNSSKATRIVEDVVVDEKGRATVVKKDRKKKQAPAPPQPKIDQLNLNEQTAREETILPYEHQGGSNLIYMDPEDSGEMDDDPDDDLDI